MWVRTLACFIAPLIIAAGCTSSRDGGSVAGAQELTPSPLATDSREAQPGSENEAQPTPDPQSGGEGKDEGKEVKERDDWFYGQRAFPLKEVPPGARNKAVRQAEALPAAVSTVESESVPATVSAAASTLPSLSWAAIGPKPIADGAPSIYNGAKPWSGRVTAIANHPTNPAVAFLGSANGGVWKTTDSGVNWAPVFDSAPSLSIGAVAISPVNGSIVYAGTGEPNDNPSSYFGAGLFRSGDGGANWSKVGGTRFDNCYISRVVVKPDASGTVLVAASGNAGKYTTTCANGIYRSNTDGSYSKVLALTSRPTDLVVKPGSPTTWYAGLNGRGVWRSLDSGSTWTQVTDGLPSTDLGRVALATTKANPNRLYVAIGTASGLTRGVWTSADSGNSWTQLPALKGFCSYTDTSPTGQCDYDIAITGLPTDERYVYVGGIRVQRWDGTTVSTLGFDNSNTTGIHVDIHALGFDASNRLWVGSDGGAYRKDPGTSNMTFANLNQTLSLTQFEPGISGSLASNSVLLAGSQDNGTMRYSAASCSATVPPCWHEFSPGDGGYSAFDPVSVKRYATYVWGHTNRFSSDSYEGCLISAEPTDVWCKYIVPGPSQFYAPIAMSPSSGTRLYVGGTIDLYYTNDASAPCPCSGTTGPTFFQLPRPANASGYVVAIAEAKSNPSVLYSAYSYGAGGSKVFVSKDGGLTWATSTAPLPNRVITEIAVKVNNPAVAWVTLSGDDSATPTTPGHLFLTQDYGATWTNISGNLPDAPANAIEVDSRTTPSTLYLATDTGQLWSQDGGTTWSRSTKLPNTVIMDIRLDLSSNKLIAATHGRGMYTTTIPSTPPTITSFTPTSATGGTSISITGKAFNYVQQVAFNGVPAVFTRVSSTSITATVPSTSTTGKITVTTPGGTASTTTNFINL